MKIHWAHIDSDGKIETWGTVHDQDVFRQALAPGLTAVARPADITGYSNVRYIDGQWVKQKELKP